MSQQAEADLIDKLAQAQDSLVNPYTAQIVSKILNTIHELSVEQLLLPEDDPSNLSEEEYKKVDRFIQNIQRGLSRFLPLN